MKKRYFFSFLFVLVSSLSAYLYFSYEDPRFLPQNLQVDNKTKFFHVTKESGDPYNFEGACSFSFKSAHEVFICNYGALFILNLETKKVIELSRPDNVKVWNPTGVLWHNPTQTLYVANYNGHDILLLKLKEDRSLELLHRFTDPEMKSPENLDVSKDGKKIAVADYDGHRIFLFDQNGKKLWSYVLGNAHGVSFDTHEKSVLATGLCPAQVCKIDLRGKLVWRKGKERWGKNGYLWPTCIKNWGQGAIVSDAHTGKISFLNENGDCTKCLGGNGLGVDLFNMPYGLEIDSQGKIFVVDTFKSRMLFLSEKGKVLSVFHTHPLVQKITQQKPFGLTYRKRCNTAKKILIGESLYHPDYSCFRSRKKNLLFSYPFPLAPGFYFYFIQGKNDLYQDHALTVFGSPQNTTWIIEIKGTLIPIKLGRDFWLQEDALVSSTGKKVDLDTLYQEAIERFQRYKRSVAAQEHPLDAICTKILSRKDVKQCRPELLESLRSEKGTLFKEHLKKASNLLEERQAAQNYLSSTQKDGMRYLHEIALANFFLQAPDAAAR